MKLKFSLDTSLADRLSGRRSKKKHSRPSKTSELAAKPKPPTKQSFKEQSRLSFNNSPERKRSVSFIEPTQDDDASDENELIESSDDEVISQKSQTSEAKY